jgi:glycogen debranching enzyme
MNDSSEASDASACHMPQPITVNCRDGNIDSLLSLEWLHANSIGAYASSTAVGCNARRYHGLLIAATMPPVGRLVALSTVMEQLTFDGNTHDLASNEFSGTFSPRGFTHLEEFRDDIAPTFIYRIGERTLKKEILLAEAANAVAIRYTLVGPPADLMLWPFAAMRDFHSLRRMDEPHRVTFDSPASLQVVITDRLLKQDALYISCSDGSFQAKPQWWNKFYYRIDMSRGQEGFEDLYTPGNFACVLADGQSVQLTASLRDPITVDFQATWQSRRSRLAGLAASVQNGDTAAQVNKGGAAAAEMSVPPATTDRKSQAISQLAMATDAFVVQRSFPNSPPSTTILAGYHWFADWGRDAFIALPGLLLSTKRFEQARNVFRTFAGSIQHGLVPNRFDDYAHSAHYNSIDASLWFIIAAERYIQATGDMKFWREHLLGPCNTILEAYQQGTLFDIHADADGLLMGGSHRTQLTWMDAALGDEVITPRHGKAVEINALWHSAHRIMADRCRGIDNLMADHYAHQADMIGLAYAKTFWNSELGWMYDCISDNWPDASLRPNQILAVSLPHSALASHQQAGIVRVVTERLLTPFGLRTLSPEDSRYRRRCGGSWESRDRAYHQGTVWAWLIGPFMEAYLKVEKAKPFALAQADKWLQRLDEHLSQAGIGYVSEIFDGDPPHNPGGCIAQAWSVAEVLRVKLLIADLRAGRATL